MTYSDSASDFQAAEKETCAYMMPYALKSAKIVTGTLFVIYAVIPACVYIFPQIHSHFLFMNFVKWPYLNFTNPRKLGVNYKSRNFYIKTEEEIQIGVWQILPQSLNVDGSHEDIVDDEDEFFERMLSEHHRPIFVYLHGNTRTRAAGHRVTLYNVLAGADFHVIALDYRGYGDSSGSPSEKGVVHDVITLFKWVQERAGSNPIFLWGHSLGTAICIAAAKKLCLQNICPNGIVLEAPFNNLGAVVRQHPYTKIFRWMPYFDKFMVEPFERIGLYFTSDERIKYITCPFLILHAKDDRVIPFVLGEKLKDEALNAGKNVTFVDYESDLDYGHKYICNDPDLPTHVKLFVQKCIAN